MLFGALGAIFHLELLDPSDEPRFEQVAEEVWDWFGAELRWTWLGVLGVERFERHHLEYVSTYPADLDQVALEPKDDEAQTVANNLAGRARSDYVVACNGGLDRLHASPYLYSFWAEIPETGPDLRLPAHAVLQICVPETCPVDEFSARVRKIARMLRLRWGGAGFTYASWDDADASADARYRHARRYPGYDLDEYARLLLPLRDEIRSINWLTLLGPDLAARLRSARPTFDGLSRVSVQQDGPNLVVQAGRSPERGDTNRLIIPDAYREADALLRPVRLRDGTGIEFLGPWSEADVTAWLQRFERRVS